MLQRDGQVHRFVPALGAAGQSELDWAVSVAFDDHIVFHGFGEDDARFVRVVHAIDGTIVDAQPSDYERVEERYVVTPQGRVQVATDSGFEDICKVPASFEPGFSRLVASSEAHLLMDSQEG